MAVPVKTRLSVQSQDIGVITAEIAKLKLNSASDVLRSIASKIFKKPLTQINLPFFSAQMTFSGHFQIIKILGEGSFGVVVLVKDNYTNEQKVFKIARERRFNHYLENEYINLKHLNKIDPLHTVRALRCHKLFMNLYKKTEGNGCVSENLTSPRVVIISDYGGKEVYQSLVKKCQKTYSFEDFMHLFCQGLSYWNYLTVNRFVQRDIKTENMLLEGPFQTPGSLRFIDPSSLEQERADSSCWYTNSRYFRSPTTLWQEISPHETSFAIAASFFEILTGSSLFRTPIVKKENREQRMKRHLEHVFDTLGIPESPYFDKIHPQLRDVFFRKTISSQGQVSYTHTRRVTEDPFTHMSSEEKMQKQQESIEEKVSTALKTRFQVKDKKDLQAIAKDLTAVFLMILKNHDVSPDRVLEHNLFHRFPNIVSKHYNPSTIAANDETSFYFG